jgi:hypothetical protein
VGEWTGADGFALGAAVSVGTAVDFGVAVGDGAKLAEAAGDGEGLGVGGGVGEAVGDGVGVGLGDGFIHPAGHRTAISVAVWPARAFSILAAALNLAAVGSNSSVLASGL